ncbi:sodium/proton antiporter, CPA1 family (TC 2.A.36) [Chitinophaga terrae (ex Kim and Jung 2007)]|uniref:Sodium/proton antiporter, CPA1 family (TC 2.A.36) n=1 Tax=Chitinophaga terrae (ex Kim and Jung 2007) TaxID=408074 RepID=A0A1H3ZCF8_9BACT|nr:sodium:proton antiporter [Chitinophaga terrae (ex Kim and Jung 2007)]GEP88667.1 Na(+)/H(+) antiporter NhaP [Chitinophaga terrae (ex Kim and Jung 2007)]SEA21064.1 sodium/proton antiporter, CPA1 family (TC 2.A.36) [Chitinophaga terrae (ex Kim and Jung 2007)]
MNTFTLITALVTISALISYINNRFIKLPGTIGVIVVSLLLSVLILLTGKIFPDAFTFIKDLTNGIDFTGVLLDVMLGFLLFASALHFDVNKLREQRYPVLVLSTIGVVGSTFVFGFLLHYAAEMLHIDLPLIYCLLFGALISPTDPVAVLSILKKSKVPSSLETIIGGESLLNDGTGILLFVILKEVAEQSHAHVTLAHTAEVFAQEVFGGILLGVVSAIVAYQTMKRVDDFQIIVMVSLSMVMVISVLGAMLHVSIPLAAVSAGLILGNTSLGARQSEEMQHYFHNVWSLIDELLNTILFVMIGLQIVIMPYFSHYWLIGLLATLFVLIARALSITVPAAVLKRTLDMNYNSIAILVWAGLRGGISVALALSLPDSPYKETILSASYFVVLFSIIVQGLTLKKVVDRFA